MIQDSIFEEQSLLIDEIVSDSTSLTFLVGAGISMDSPSNLPSARELCKNLLTYCVPKNELQNILQHKDLRYELVVENIQTFFNHNFKFMDYFELKKSPNIIHYFLAQNIINGNYVVTTNFDYFLEHALMNLLPETLHKNITPIITKQDFIKLPNPEKLFKKELYPLYKIHGSKRNIITGVETRASLITTITSLGKNREEGKTFAIETYKKPAVESLMHNRILIVIGYSGSDDFDIGPVLKEFPDVQKLIWIDHCNEDTPKFFRLPKNGTNIYPEQQLSHLDQLLLEIRKKVNYEIIKIQVNSKKFIENDLAPFLTPNILSNPPAEELNVILPFSEWIKPIYESIKEIEKFQFITQIYYDLRDFVNSINTAKIGLKLAKSLSIKNLESYFNNLLGLNYKHQGDFSHAKKFLALSLNYDKKSRSYKDQIVSLNDLAVLYDHEGNTKKALKMHLDALKLTEKMKETDAETQKVTLFSNIGLIYAEKGNLDKAKEFYDNALKLESKIGDLESKASTLVNIGEFYRKQSEWEKAEENFNEAIKISDEIGDIATIGYALNNLGLVFDSRKMPDKAIEFYQKSFEIAETLHDLESKATLLNNMGYLYKQQDKIEQAEKMYSEALSIFQSMENLSGIQTCFNNLANIHLSHDEYDQAIEMYTAALEIAKKTGDASLIATIHNNLGYTYIQKKEFDLAFNFISEALKINQDLHDLEAQTFDLNNLATLFENKKDYKKAIEYYQQELEINRKLKDNDSIESDLSNIEELNKKLKTVS